MHILVQEHHVLFAIEASSHRTKDGCDRRCCSFVYALVRARIEKSEAHEGLQTYSGASTGMKRAKNSFDSSREIPSRKRTNTVSAPAIVPSTT